MKLSTQVAKSPAFDAQKEIEELREEINALKGQMGKLLQASSADKLDRKTLREHLTYIENNLAATNRRLNDLYDSRIWRTLVAAARFWMNLSEIGPAGRRRLQFGLNTCRALLIRHFRSGADQVHITSDFPSPQNVTPLCGKMEIRGWASAKSGIAKLEIFIGDRPVENVEYGIARPDVGDHLPAFLGSDRSGFRAFVEVNRFRNGRQDLRITCKARSGFIQQLICPVIIDPRTEYQIWLERNSVNDRMRKQLEAERKLFQYTPKISIVTPVYKTPKDLLVRCIESVQEQVYPNWEHILVDDGSESSQLRGLLQEYARRDERIRVFSMPRNSGIALATNEGLKRCAGEFVGFLDHDDEIAPNALFEVVNELNLDRDWDLFYTDEDKIATDGGHTDPYFKPDWSPDLLLSANYICHFLVCRRSLLEAVGGLRTGFEGSQDYDLALRLTERTDRVRRIPKVLYHWRISATSTASSIHQKPAASFAGLRAIQERLDRTAPGATAEEIFPSVYRARYPLKSRPEIDIIIPTGGSPKLEKALQTVLEQTTYPNYRITVVDNSRSDSVQKLVRGFDNTSHPIHLMDCRRIPFNFSLLCNRPARISDSPYLLFLNDDTSIITPDWIEAMLEHAQRPEVGAVGALLLFPDDRIQHAGVILGPYGLAGHSFRFMTPERHYFSLPKITRNCSAVTGACLLTRRETFWEVGGFEEVELPLAFQDVDFCLKLHKKGYRIIYTPHAMLYHYESATKTKVAFQYEIDYMKQHWGNYIVDDPHYNPNLTRNREDYSLRL